MGNFFAEFAGASAEAWIGLYLDDSGAEVLRGELFDGNFDAGAKIFDAGGDAGLVVGDRNANKWKAVAESFQSCV